jgi:O-methyltransferase / aklanonic acid methyltransferase
MPGMAFDPHRIAAVFGRAASSYDSVVPFFTHFGARLVDVAGLGPGESVLDVGCGRGATLLPAAERVGPAGRVVGVDLAPEMVALLKADIDRRGLAQASVRLGDAGALDVEPGSFDVVICSFVLHLLPDPEATAAGMAAALRPGGRCVAAAPAGSGPDWDFLLRVFGAYADRAGPPEVPFRPDFDLGMTLRGAGLEVTSTAIEATEFHFADEQAWWAWAWTQGMRSFLESLAPADLEAMQRELLAEVAARRTAAGIAMPQRAVFVVAEKPAG